MLILTLGLAVAPVARAQEAVPEDDGGTLMQRGMELFFDGLREEMSPALREMQELFKSYGPSMRHFMVEMGPGLSDIFEKVDDWTEYDAPEMLDNGDIIIRKRPEDPYGEDGTEPPSADGSTEI